MKKFNHKFIVLLSVAFLCFIGISTYKVFGVSDGDTIKVRFNGVETRIRLAAIDAPEKNQAFGQVSKKKLSDLIYMKDVNLEIIDTDRYGRKIAFVYLDGVNINLEMVKSGLAWHYKKYSSDVTFAKAEEEAKKNKKGLWADANPVAPWDFRHQ